MSDEPALLAAILAHPDEDTPRLMYADWLQENGQPERAEFIRVQIELAKLTASGKTNTALGAREQSLLRLQKMNPWDPTGVLIHGNGQFYRGFIHAAQLHATTYISVAEQLFSIAPVRNVLVKEVERRLAEVSLVPRPATARVWFESGRRPNWRWNQTRIDILNPDLVYLEEHVRVGRWVIVVWARWNSDDRRAAETAIDRAEYLARAGTNLGLRPMNLAIGLESMFPMLENPFATPRWLHLQDGQLRDDFIGSQVPPEWLAAAG